MSPYFCGESPQSGIAKMDNEESEEHVVTEVTPASSENDLDEKRSEESEEEGDELEQKSQIQADHEGESSEILSYVPPSQPLDQFRFSISAIEGSGEVDLDALLEDLCVMEKDMNFGNETSLMPSQTLSSSNCPLSPKVKQRKQGQDIDSQIYSGAVFPGKIKLKK
ncbi:hypothetical protein P5673_015911 [Acropora cervicornis]|uniref:Uncharacterized protein n=1 Tax=Acropora cervicornis TaxID=6130 RepID=A0AAD9V518_ACRCE|nr:hypothetical protein P5673_015911 [Acropora cervicornis]